MILREIAIPLGAFAVVGAFASSCPSNPVGPSTPDAGVGGDARLDSSIASCQTACDAMKRVGCVVLSDCAATICKVNADPRFAHYNLDCLVKVLVPADVAACGADCRISR